MSVNKRLSKNIVYSILLQIVTLILPFITTPYVSRVLTPIGTGIYSYTNSIVSYFTFVAGFGLATYGTRQIAFIKNNKKELNKTFSSLLYFKFLISMLVLGVYACLFVWVEDKYKVCLGIQTLLILSSAVDITWLYYGLEDFKPTVIRTIIVKVITVILTFIFVKEYKDLWIYVLIMSGGTFGGNIILWNKIKEKVILEKISFNEIISNFKPAGVVFISFIAIEIYTVVDKTMLGILTSDQQVGFYTYSEQFAKAALGIIGAISTAMLPYMSRLKVDADKKNFDRNFNVTLNIITMIGTAASFGMAGIAKEFIPWMLGKEYFQSITLLIMLSPLALIISTSNVISKTFLLPQNKEKICNIAVMIGAAINLLLNIIFIPQFQAVGACIATLIAEIAVTCIHMYAVRKSIFKKVYLKTLLQNISAGIVMYCVIRSVGSWRGSNICTTFIQIFIGGLVYVGVLYGLGSTIIKNLLLVVKSKSTYK